MKQIHLILLLFFAVLTFPVFGQTPIDFDKVETTDPDAPRFSEPHGYQTLGFDIGWSYQTSDVRAAYGGWGIGLTYEKNIAHLTGGALDLGLRGRLMYANSKGFDKSATVGTRDNPLAIYKNDASFFANHLTNHGELAVEGVLTFNRLRERTGIYATLFGGIGIVGYDVKVNQLDDNGLKYNYKLLGDAPSVPELRSFYDNSFETRRLGGDTLTVGFMPSIGGEIGFHVSSRFMIVLGHKWMFTRTDLFDGKEYINKTEKGVRNDWHHYTNIELKWILGEHKRRSEYPQQPNPPRPTDYPTPTPTPTPYPTPKEQLPIVQFTSPSSNLETERERLSIRVRIQNVAGYDNVNLSVNGRDTRDFAFRNGELTADVPLNEGANSITVVGRNSVGSASDAITIILRRQRPVAPTVQITSTGTPTSDSYGGCQTSYEARVNNVNSQNDISVTLNGRSITNFSFNNTSKILRGSLSLVTGSNRLIIAARNDIGTGQDERSMTCAERPRQAAPTVRISQPSNGQIFENNPVEIRAKVENVTNRNQIEVFLNGNRITDFVYYNYDKSVIARVPVNVGENQVRIVATNEAGSMEDATRFSLREKPRSYAPTVQILRPSNNSRVGETTVNVEAKVENVTDKNGIQVTINGAEDRSFTFDIYTKMVRTRANIRDGQNTITVFARNETGNAQASVTVTKRAIILPPPPSTTPPTVQISSPANGSRTSEPTGNLSATVQNVVQNQVRVLLNDQEVPFSLSGRQVQAELAWQKGQNRITVRAVNDDGSAEKTISVTYTQAKRLPDIVELPTGGGTLEQEPTISNFNATQPVVDPFDPKPAVSIITATVGNVTNGNQIELYRDGAQQTNFTFDVATQQLRWSFEPRGGVSYTFNIVAKNGVGRASKTEVVKY